MRQFSIFLTALAAATLVGQASAKNTNDDWKWAPEYYATYGEWTVACEHRSDDQAVQRCYLRYVEVYANAPFGAMFVFLTDTSDIGLRFNFEYETGARFSKDWMVIADGQTSWQFNTDRCPAGSECPIIGPDADALAAALNQSGGAMAFSFTDTVQRSFDLAWPTDGFADALSDLREQSRARDL